MRRKVIKILLAVLVVCCSICALACSGGGVGGLTTITKTLEPPQMLRIENGSLCWNPVEYATKYTVNIDGAEYFSDTNVYPLSAVKDGEHVFRVKANGDGVLYNTSAYSSEYLAEIQEGASVSKGYYGQFDELTKKESFLGYGFDVINSSVFHDKSVKMSFCIFNTDQLMQQRLIKVDSKGLTIDETYAKDIETFTEEWNAKANVNVSWGKKRIGGSVDLEAYFSGGRDSAKSKSFHCISINNQSFYIVMQSDMDTYKSILSEGFKKDLYSDMAPAELFSKYGTHFITSAIMGGRINSYYLYTSESEKDFLDISAKVSTEVRYLAGKTDVNMGGGYKEEAESEKISITNKIQVLGGDKFGILSDADIGKKYEEWEKSLDDHPLLIGIKDTSSLIPIWNLIDSSLDSRNDYTWTDENGQEQTGSRSQQLQGYFMKYGVDSYNSLMEAAGLPKLVTPESIQNVKINGNSEEDGEFEVYAGTLNDISFSVLPEQAYGYTKNASISGKIDEADAKILNSEGLQLQIGAGVPNDTTIDLVLTAGSVRKTVKVRVIQRYTLSINPNNGESVNRIPNIVHGDLLLRYKPQDPIWEGYTFIGWYSDAYLTQKFDFATPIVKDTTIYAKWEEYKPLITFVCLDKNGATLLASQAAIDSFKIDYNTTIKEPANLSTENYDFVGFYSDEQMLERFDFNKKITQDTTLYAKWTPKKYTVRFYANGGTIDGKAEIQVEYNGYATEAKCAKAGYEFGGWFKDPDLNFVYDFYTDKVTGDLNLYAKWSKNLIIIKFNSGCQDITLSNRKVEYDSSLSAQMPEITRGGYDFLGWYKESSFETLVSELTIFNDTNFEGVSQTRQVELFAKWKAIEYTVRYNFNGGVKVVGGNYPITYTVETVSTISNLQYATYPEYNHFVGWYEDADCTIVFDNDLDKKPKNVELFAKWDLCVVYSSIDSAPFEVAENRVIFDWRGETNTNLLQHTNRKVDNGRYDNFDICPTNKELVLMGTTEQTFTNLVFHLCWFASENNLTIRLNNFSFETNYEAIRTWECSETNITLAVDGNCAIGTLADGGNIINVSTANLTILGSGNLTITAGNGAPGQNDGDNGGNGGYGISCKQLRIKQNVGLTVYGGNGGNGKDGSNGAKGDNGSKGNDASKNGGNFFSGADASDGDPGKNGGNGGTGGNGGNGGNAICSLEYFYNESSNAMLIGGNGGNGGKGGNGGNGGDKGFAYEGTLEGVEINATNGQSGLGGNGGYGGSKGAGGAGGDAGKNGSDGNKGDDGEDGEKGAKGSDGN